MGSGREALQVLQELRPQFHPDPARVDGALENQFTAGPREVAGAGGASYAIGGGVLQYLADLPESGGTSVETGCGYSTVVLSNVFATHVTVNPDLASNRLVREFVERHCGATGLRHVESSSDQGLPGLVAEGCRVELALIDGNHSHPFPLLDFHYMDQLLEPGGRLLVDNTEIHAVQELTEYLEMEGAYEVERQIGNCAVYRKVADRKFGWKSQAIRRGTDGVDAVRRELTRLRAELAPDLRASLSGAAPLPTEPHAATVDIAPTPLGRGQGRPAPGPRPAARRAYRPTGRQAHELLRWYASPSGTLAAGALILLAIGFVGPGLWRLIGVAGVLALGLFLPYRFVREQRRTDRRIDQLLATLRRDTRVQVRSSVDAAARRFSELELRSSVLDSSLENEIQRLTEITEQLAALRRTTDEIEARLKPSRRFSPARLADPRLAELGLRDATTGLSQPPRSGDPG